MSRLRKMLRRGPQDNTGTADGAPAYAYCETVLATATSPWHIRQVGPEGLKPGGGVPGNALCGRDLLRGWDLNRPISLPDLRMLQNYDGPLNVCQACATVYQQQISDGS